MDSVSNHHVHMAPRHTILDIHDQATNGATSQQIHAWRSEGLSVNEVAFRLREQGIQIDPKTLTRWLKRQDEEAAYRTLLDPEAFDSEAS